MEKKGLYKAILYSRVSTVHDEQAESIDNQILLAKNYLDKHPNIELAEPLDKYSERISGKTDIRPKFQEMCERLSKGDIDYLMIKDLKRLSRSVETTYAFLNLMKQYGFEIIQLSSGNIIDSSAFEEVESNLLIGIEALFAQNTVLTQSRYGRTVQRVRCENKILSYKDSTLFGYEWDPQTDDIVINERKAEIVREVFNRYVFRNQSLREIREYLSDSSWHWGEWKEPGTESEDYYEEGIRTGHAEIATAYLAYGCGIVAEMAAKLGDDEDAAFFGDAAEKAKAAYRYVYTDNGRIESDRQCMYVRPIYMDLLSEGEKRHAADGLTELIRKQGRIGTGLLTTQELCKVLCDYGHRETAYDLLLSEKWPSWLYEIDMGATTVWEDWRGNRDHHPFYSQNHYMYATIAGWLIMYSAGIRVADGIINVRPYPDRRLGHAEAVFRSYLGEIRSSWKYEGDSIKYEITIPANAKAKMILPDLPEHEAGPGTYRFTGPASY